MERRAIKTPPGQVTAGQMGMDSALLRLKMESFEELGFTKLGNHRGLRQRVIEVIYDASKTPEQITRIVDAIHSGGRDTILITRMSTEATTAVNPAHPFVCYETGRTGIMGSLSAPDGSGKVVVAIGGISDVPMAEKATLTVGALGNEVACPYDVGVAGLHRLLSHLEELTSADVIITVAGIEGILVSVIGGLVGCLVIVVPTGINCEAYFHGLSSLLSILDPYTSGMSVVSIDDGSNASYLASMVNHMGGKQK